MTAPRRKCFGAGAALLAAAALLGLPSVAGARPLQYGAVDSPALAACDAEQWSGKQDEARQCYTKLLAGSSDPLLRAESAWALGDVRRANTEFRAAAAAEPMRSVIKSRWGELYVQTYQYQDALDLCREALSLDPDNAYATVCAARALSESFDPQGPKMLEGVVNDEDAPDGARFDALLLLATASLEDSNPEQAGTLVDRASALADRHDWLKLQVYGLRAAMQALRGEDTEPWTQMALDANPHWGQVYAVPGHFMWITRRYREAVDFYQKAVDLQPDLWEAQLELGVNAFRLNEVERAREHLEIAYKGDPFNPKTVNTLRLLDTFDTFDVVQDPKIPPPDGFPVLTMRLARDEEAVLAPYVRRLARKSIDLYTRQWQFKPRAPVVVEVYPNHDDFVVRTTGMPGLGILGATFGYVLAMDSPTANPEPGYHWGTTLWHEMAHVFTLRATDNLVPRWFSEGASVFEEWSSGPIPGIRIPVNVLEAMRDDRFLPVAKLDGGFIRPSYPGQVNVSYTQAGLICTFIKERAGVDGLVTMLHAFGERADTATAIRRTLDMTPKQFDAAFDDWVDGRFGKLLKQLPAWEHAQQAAGKAAEDEDWPGALKEARRAIALYPEYVDAGSGYIVAAAALRQLGREDEEFDTLERYHQLGGYRPDAGKRLAAMLHERGRDSEAAEVLDSLNYVAPFDPEVHATLGDRLLELNRPRAALQEFQVLMALKPHDMADAHYRLARAYHALNDSDSTRSELLQALSIAPHFRAAQQLLLETVKTQP